MYKYYKVYIMYMTYLIYIITIESCSMRNGIMSHHQQMTVPGRGVRFAVTAPGLRIVGTALTRRWPPTDTTAFLGSGDRAARAEAATAAARRIYICV